MTGRRTRGSRPRAGGAPNDRVAQLPGYGAVDEAQFAGYASVRGTTGDNGASAADERLFYWFVGAQDYEHKPTILWTNGGPGSSSFWGFFLENGPYEIDPTGKKLSRRAHAWNHHANYMIFEHPLSVMLSVAQDEADIPMSVEQGIAQLYQALLNFVALHPEVARTPIILAGESYAGTYLPLLAKAILRGNHTGQPELDLRAMVLCDAWVDPMEQMAVDTAWAYAHGLPNYDYLNDPKVRAALHVPEGYPKLTKSWSQAISDNYQARVNESYRHVVQELLDGATPAKESLLLRGGGKLKVRVVSGLNDAKDCNFLGTAAWARAPSRSGRVPLPRRQARAVAGHMAARDQPHLVHFVLDSLKP